MNKTAGWLINQEIKKSKKALRSPANSDPVDQEWLRGHINGLQLALTVLGEK